MKSKDYQRILQELKALDLTSLGTTKAEEIHALGEKEDTPPLYADALEWVRSDAGRAMVDDLQHRVKGTHERRGPIVLLASYLLWVVPGMEEDEVLWPYHRSQFVAPQSWEELEKAAAFVRELSARSAIRPRLGEPVDR